MIEVMQAFINGREIEYKLDIAGNEDWKPNKDPAWNWNGFDYRVKKEPSNKFKVGDYVLVLDGKDIPNYISGWVKDMERYVGRIFRIASFNSTAYRLDGAFCYNFDERGLALVEVITSDNTKKEDRL